MSQVNGKLGGCVLTSYHQHLCARSLYKRTLDTSSRFKYIKDAFLNMKKWIEDGTDEVKKLKRYIHRYLALPSGGYDEDGKELLKQFAFEYVQALLTYCSDDIKSSMCLGFLLACLCVLLAHSYVHY